MIQGIKRDNYATVHDVAEFVCDTISDLDLLPTTTQPSSDGKSQPCAAGSTAYVLAEKRVYILNTEGEWVLYKANDASGGGGGNSESVEEVTGSTPSITGVANTRYKCGEVESITITPPESGTIDIFFTSGSTAATLTVPNTVKFPSWFDASDLDTNTIYEIIITDAIYGVVTSWVA